VFAALQMANELLQFNMHNTTQVESTQRLERMARQIDDAVNPPLDTLI
jgi:hypothetical protein